MAQPRTNGLASRVNDGNVKWFTLIAACFGLFMAILDNLVVNIAMPTIAQDLDASTTQLQWIVSAYTLIFASLLFAGGVLGDRLGHRNVLLAGLLIFGASSVWAAYSNGPQELIIARGFMGAGSASGRRPGSTRRACCCPASACWRWCTASSRAATRAAGRTRK